jgi:hypothetical protein
VKSRGDSKIFFGKIKYFLKIYQKGYGKNHSVITKNDNEKLKVRINQGSVLKVLNKKIANRMKIETVKFLQVKLGDSLSKIRNFIEKISKNNQM